MKLRKFIEKQYSIMSQTDLARSRLTGPTEQTGVGYGVMRTPERPTGHKAMLRIRQAANAVNFGRLNRFLQRKRRQNRRDPFCYHRLSGTRRSRKKDIMGSCSSDFDGAIRVLLTFNFAEIQFQFGVGRIGPIAE